LERSGWFEPGKAPTQEKPPTQLIHQNVKFVGNMCQEENQNAILVKLPKPPDPPTLAGGGNEVNNTNVVDDAEEAMLVENPPLRQ
jgi:hypothetical protein